jgi:catechol 2,3-dioxygenase-like lactoylglutathione lyase family enzyme
MKINHFHVYVRDLPAATEWFERVCEAKLGYHDEHMASLSLGGVQLLIDKSDADSRSTIGFATENCDAEFAATIGRGAIATERPSDRPWGVRAAYLRGPGEIVVELEQMLQMA